MRRVDEWIAKHDDAKVPPRVRLRVFLNHEGKCWLSGRKIAPGEVWELEHKVALCNGGEHRENNLAPALKDKHREKTAADVAEKAVIYRKASKHHGARERKPWPKAVKTPAPPQRRASSPLSKTMPPRRVI